MKVDRRFRNGLMITNSYTLSRSKDYVNENTGIGTPIDFELSWARSNFDRLHNYVLTTIYELPMGPGTQWLSDGLAGKIIGGWQVSGVYNLQSGTPLTIGGNGTLLNTPGNSAFANLNGEHKVLGGLGPGLLYFDPAVYSLPPAGTQGNLSAQQRPRGSGLLEPRHVALQAVRRGRNALRRGTRRRLQRDERRALGQPRTPDTASAAGNTFGQITGTDGRPAERAVRRRFAF